MALSLFSLVALCAALVLIAVLLFGAGRRSLATWGLLAGLSACLLVELGDLAALGWPVDWLQWKRLTLLGESLVPSCWLFYAAAFGRDRWRALPSLALGLVLAGLALPLLALLLPLNSVYFSPDFADERILFLGTTGYWFYLALLTMLVPPLVQLERILGALGDSDRWQVKFELVGAGAVLAGLFIYSGQGLLYRSLDMNLLPVRSLGLGLGGVLMLYSRLRRGGGGQAQALPTGSLRLAGDPGGRTLSCWPRSGRRGDALSRAASAAGLCLGPGTVGRNRAGAAVFGRGDPAADSGLFA